MRTNVQVGTGAESFLRVSARHVAEARDEEAALARKLDSGLFGEAARGRPWPEHDLALCIDYQREAAKSWVHALDNLLHEEP